MWNWYFANLWLWNICLKTREEHFWRNKISPLKFIFLYSRYLKNVSVEGDQGKPNIEFTQDGVLKAAELKIMNLRPGVSKQLVWEEVSGPQEKNNFIPNSQLSHFHWKKNFHPPHLSLNLGLFHFHLSNFSFTFLSH